MKRLLFDWLTIGPLIMFVTTLLTVIFLAPVLGFAGNGSTFLPLTAAIFFLIFLVILLVFILIIKKLRVSGVGALIKFLWYGVFILFILYFFKNRNLNLYFENDLPTLILIIDFIFLLLIFSFFYLVHLLIEGLAVYVEPSNDKNDAALTSGSSFPAPSTRLVACLIAILGVVCFTGLIVMMIGPGWGTNLFVGFGQDRLRSVQEAFVMMFAAGIGATIRTMLAYVRHASNQKDFSIAWLPWYVIRPTNGMLLGLIFYFLLRGGLLMVVLPGGSDPIDGLNIWGLAAIGAIVGLFSREALDKLREVFNNIFQMSKPELDEAVVALLDKLPEELREKVEEHIKPVKKIDIKGFLQTIKDDSLKDQVEKYFANLKEGNQKPPKKEPAKQQTVTQVGDDPQASGSDTDDETTPKA